MHSAGSSTDNVGIWIAVLVVSGCRPYHKKAAIENEKNNMCIKGKSYQLTYLIL